MGTLLAVFLVYYKTIWELIVELFRLIGDVFTGKFKWKEMSFIRRMLIMLIISCLPLLLLMIPVGGGNKLMDVFTGITEKNNLIIVGCCFLFTAFVLLMGTYVSKRKQLRDQANAKDAVVIGIGQLLAASFSGISRSGTTISSGLISGVSKEYMVKYSFILGIPAILAANVLEISDAISSGGSIDILPTLVGVVTAAIFGVLAIKALQWIVRKNHLNIFGYYCLALGCVVVILGVLESTGIRLV